MAQPLTSHCRFLYGQMFRQLQDQENGADLNNGETFGDDWALQSWSYEEALAANQRLAKYHQPRVPHWVPQHEGILTPKDGSVHQRGVILFKHD